MHHSRLHKTLINAKFSLLFYLFLLLANFIARSYFINLLGSEYVGLITIVNNFIGVLSLAEMGFASVITFALFKPLANKDFVMINEIITIIKFCYHLIGITILSSGLLFSLYAAHFFHKSNIEHEKIIFTFYTFLFITLLSYFYNFREVLLVADQRNYVKAALLNGSKILKIIAQVIALKIYSHYLSWLFIEALFAIIYSVLLNKKINEYYPNIMAGVINKSLLKKHVFILIKVRQSFFHKLCGISLQQTTAIFVYLFSSLPMVTIYTNYTIVTLSLLSLVNSLFDSLSSSVGNLIVEGKKLAIENVYWQLNVLRFLIATSVAYTCAISINYFIIFWLGHEYLIEDKIKYSLIAVLFILIVRKTNDEFLTSNGIFHDVWAAVLEMTINLALIFWLGRFFGIVAIPLSACISMIIIVCCWKPFFLHKEFFKKSVVPYFFKIISYVLVSTIGLSFSSLIPIYQPNGVSDFLLFVFIGSQAFISSISIVGVLYVVFFKEMRELIKRLYFYFS
ncbi:hypothetical protein [Sodalis sp. RH13]|uniref:hypothetical protein n=1 Tax=Sodalis sp. RH13 TaxID=3394328 RepID=UPI0039B61965